MHDILYVGQCLTYCKNVKMIGNYKMKTLTVNHGLHELHDIRGLFENYRDISPNFKNKPDIDKFMKSLKFYQEHKKQMCQISTSKHSYTMHTIQENLHMSVYPEQRTELFQCHCNIM
jgi:hypothetical protein